LGHEHVGSSAGQTLLTLGTSLAVVTAYSANSLVIEHGWQLALGARGERGTLFAVFVAGGTLATVNKEGTRHTGLAKRGR